MENEPNSVSNSLVFVAIVVVLLLTIGAILITRGNTDTTPVSPTSTPVPTLTGTPTGVEEGEFDLNPTLEITPNEEITPVVSETIPASITPGLTITPIPTSSNVKELNMNVFEYAFEPASIPRMPAGAQLQIAIKNTGTTEHNFVIDDLGIQSEVISPGDTKMVVFTLPVNQKTSYSFYSSIGQDRQMGLTGTIDVIQ